MTQVTDIDRVKELIRTDDVVVGKFLVALWERQTEDEREDGQTRHLNGMGFTGVDAPIDSSFAQQFLKRGFLTPKQVAIGRRILGKYAGQLVHAST